jgi:acyl-CoA synthetase (AMP-forming)/AMP-acid ligase II
LFFCASFNSDIFQIKDRIKDVIISGGENISSIEVQSVVLRHPAVANAAVVAMVRMSTLPPLTVCLVFDGGFFVILSV